MANPYIPARDADFSAWLLNFSTLITANPTTYGLSSGDALAIDVENTAFQAAYVLAVDPATRTAPTVAAKDAARRNAEIVVRPFAIQVRNNPMVTNEQRADLGITIPTTVPTPIPAPTSFPVLGFRSATPLQHLLNWTDSAAPSGKAKPYGVIGVEVYRTIGLAPAVDPSVAVFDGIKTKSPFFESFASGQVGQVCTYFARYTTRSGPQGTAQVGPWSAPLSVTVI